jgi:small subunit ribosomal protein S6
MFLVDSALASDDWDSTLEVIRNLLTRYEADIETIKKWDSRKLAYNIKGKSHGTYILAYFRMDGTNIASIERDVQLSEKIMRVMILRTDRMSQEDLERLTPNDKIEQREKEIAESRERQAAEVKETSDTTAAVVQETSDTPAAEVKETEQPQQETAADEIDPEETQLEMEAVEDASDDMDKPLQQNTHPPLEDDQQDSEEKTVE